MVTIVLVVLKTLFDDHTIHILRQALNSPRVVQLFPKQQYKLFEYDLQLRPFVF